MQSRVAIVVPVYQKTLKKSEVQSLELLKKHLHKYPIIFLASKKYTPPKELFEIENSTWKFFDEYYFTSVKAYSELLLTSDFYKRFLKYSYIFIYQLDGLVVNSDLDYWCNLGYSYIGAPWTYSFTSLLTHPKHKFMNITGNGGVSLRKVKDHYDILEELESEGATNTSSLKDLIQSLLTLRSNKIWLKTNPSEYPFNEDGFWSLEAPKYKNSFTVAPVDIAAAFCLEKSPKRLSNKYLHGKLPFAAHGWEKYEPSWWEEKLNDLLSTE